MHLPRVGEMAEREAALNTVRLGRFGSRSQYGKHLTGSNLTFSRGEILESEL